MTVDTIQNVLIGLLCLVVFWQFVALCVHRKAIDDLYDEDTKLWVLIHRYGTKTGDFAPKSEKLKW